jgi:hypothetical protein
MTTATNGVDLRKLPRTFRDTFGDLPSLYPTQRALENLSILSGYLHGLLLHTTDNADNVQRVIDDFKRILTRLCRLDDNTNSPPPGPRYYRYKTKLYHDAVLDYEFQWFNALPPSPQLVYSPQGPEELVERVYIDDKLHLVDYVPVIYGGLICDRRRLLGTLNGEKHDYIWSSHT